MDRKELYKKVYSEILDYSDQEVISRCSKWGYEVEKTLSKNNRYLVQGGAESASSFMYAVVTAVIMGEFAKRAFNDYFPDETEIDLNLLGVELEQIKGFIKEDISRDRIEYLEKENRVGLQDMWSEICEWKGDIYSSLVDIYGQQGVSDPDEVIMKTLVDALEPADKTHSNPIVMYEYVSNGFQ